ncbi:MAG: hypothetical protein ACRDUY_13980 [Nitriliruptorales bacterium]
MTEEPDPDGAARRDDAVECPWCGEAEVELIGGFGPMHMTEQWHCRACLSPFERVRRR